MVHIPFDTRSVGYDDHHMQQFGAGSTTTGPLAEPYNYFRGSSAYQRGFGRRQIGSGIGDVLRGLWRFLLPVVRRAGTAVGREAVSTGGRILDRLAEGQGIKEAVVGEGKKGMDTLLERGGMPKQFGTGRRRTIKGRKGTYHQTIIGKKLPTTKNSFAKKRRHHRIDTLGLY